MFSGTQDDDDDIFFTPKTSSNLASLFGVNVQPTNANLTYKAPKQPPVKAEDVKNSPTKTKYQSSIILFKEVLAFKTLPKNSSLSQGKCGFTLIGNDSVHIYQLLLYKNKSDIICLSKVCNQFQFILQNDHCASYCDDQNNNWTVQFQSESDASDFAQAIETHGGKIINQNVKPETSLGKDNDIGKDVKDGGSGNQSDDSTTHTKANILSRMARMGQKLLPNANVSDGTDSDTEKERTVHKAVKSSPKLTLPVVSDEIKTDQKSVALNPTISRKQLTPQQCVLLNGQYVPVASPHQQIFPLDVSTPPMVYQSPQLPYDLNVFFAENRTHNSELRMNMLRLNSKLEEMSEKMNKFNSSSTVDENQHLKATLSELEKTIKDIKLRQMQNQDEHTKALEKQKNEYEETILRLAQNENERNKTITELEFQLQNRKELQSLTLMEKFPNLEETIKKSMNLLYKKIEIQFKDEEPMLGKDIKKILVKNIVDSTYHIIAGVNELINTDSNI